MGSTSWEIPRFDKTVNSGAGDRTDPEKIFTKPQIILFEGWFVGVRPVDPDLIQKQVAESDRQFVLKMNAKLQDYLPLWQKLDGLWLLLPQDYRYSIKWRQEAEHKLTTGMSGREIEQFVHYFWRSLPPEIFITPLRSSRFVDLVIEINSDHEVTALTIPVLQH
jgi:D-glycerate 3-kinase